MTAKKETMNILQRINAVQLVVTYIQKDKKQGMNYSIVSHDKVTAKVRPEFVKQGVLYFPVNGVTEQTGNRTSWTGAVRFVNIDEPTDYIDVSTFGYGLDTQDKGPGKALSYAVKFALLKVLGLETGDGMDPDQDQTTEFHDPSNPHMVAIADFLEDIKDAGNKEEVTAKANTHAPHLREASKHFPSEVQSAKTKLKMKLKTFETETS